MKKESSVLFIAALLSASCSSDDVTMELDGTHSVVVRTYAAGDTQIEFPVSVDVYDSQNKVVANQTIEAAGGNASMSLVTGNYTLVVSSGDRDFSNGYTTASPFMMGKKEISLTRNLEESVTMQYQVASVTVTLDDIADDVTAVSVSVGPQYAVISATGELGGSVSPTIECTKTAEGKWTTGTFYVLPSVESVTKIVIKQTSSDATKTFNIECSYPLEAGKPYIFNGSYDSSFASYMLSVSVLAEGWDDEISKDFVFDDSNSTTIPETPGEPDQPATGETLTAGTLWNGHIVALVDGNTATLLSTKEWNLGNQVELPEADIAAYKEDDISGWALPDEALAKEIAQTYSEAGGKLDAINAMLQENSLTQLHANKPNKTSDIRYLCIDGTKAFSFENYNNIVTVTSNNASRDYRMRLVKTVKMQ